MKSKKTISEESLICRVSEQVFSEIDNEIIMLSISKGEYYNFDEAGSTIWKMLEKPTTIKSLVLKLLCIYDVSNDICKTDTKSFIGELIEKELIYVVDEKNK